MERDGRNPVTEGNQDDRYLYGEKVVRREVVLSQEVPVVASMAQVQFSSVHFTSCTCIIQGGGSGAARGGHGERRAPGHPAHGYHPRNDDYSAAQTMLGTR